MSLPDLTDLNARVYDAIRDGSVVQVVHVPFTEKNKTVVKTQLESRGFKVIGFHVDVDKTAFFILELNKVAMLETRIAELQAEVTANKTRLATLETAEK